MINLKLAEYNKDGKFQGLLELGKDFLFGGDYILIIKVEATITFSRFDKDKKDPLKRCNEIFNGLTYGEGRFILIENDNFSIYQQKFFCKNMEKFGYGLSLGGKISCSLKNFSEFGNKYIDTMLPEKIGNLFENPELYEKIK
jgi:hypothetical protein